MRTRYLYHINALFVCLLLASQPQASTKLVSDANRQQQQMLEKHGQSCSAHWHQTCEAMLTELALTRFKSCLISNARHPNAYALANGNLIVTKGLLLETRNADQLAHVLSHEHAHLVLNHHQQTANLINDPPVFFTKSKIKKHYRKIELAADDYADEHLIKHQKDHHQINHYLMRLSATDDRKSVDHPKLAKRIQHKDLPPEQVNQAWVSNLSQLSCED